MAGRSDREPRTVLGFLLQRQDRTYEEVAREFGVLAEQLGERGVSITPRHLRRLSSGEQGNATPATRRVLQAMFGMTADRLFAAFDPAAPPASVGQPPAQEPDRAGRISIPSDVELLAAAAERAREYTLHKDVPVGPEGIDQLAEELHELAQLYLVVPLPTILGRLVAAQDEILRQLEHRHRPVHSRQLYFLATVAGGMLAYAADDIGRPQLALTHTRSAFMWADYADHNGLRAWIRGLQSLISFWSNRPRDAVRYAELGNPFAELSRSTAAPWLFASEARARAVLGDVAGTHEMIEKAERAQDRVASDDLDEIGGICSFLPARHAYYAARALASLPGEEEQAAQLSERAVAAFADPQAPGWDFTCQADSYLSLALAHAGKGELDAVSDSLRPVLELPPDRRIAEFDKTLDLVHRRLIVAGSDPRVQEIQEEIEAFTRSSLSHFPI